MPKQGHSHRKRRKRNLIDEFLDRLRGKKRNKSFHHSEFPGISLPKDYNPESWKEKGKEANTTGSRIGTVEEEGGKVPSQNLPHKISRVRPVRKKRAFSKRIKAFFDSIRRYFKQREFRKEERLKKKMKKKHRRRSLEKARKMNKGPGIGKRLFTWTAEGEETGKEKKISLFSQHNPLYRNLTITVNSIFVFLITYTLVYLFYWLTSMLVASFYGLDSTLYYYDLKFNDYSPLWTRFNILLITGIPPFFCLFLGLFLYRVLFKIKKFVGLQKLFILWGAFHLFNHFFGAIPSGIVTDEGFGYVAAWLYMNTAIKFLFSLISLFGLGIIGYYSAKHILETSDSVLRIKGDNRLSFILFQIAIPWLIGTIFLLLIRLPHDFDYPYETLMLFSVIFLIIPPFFNEKVKPELNLMKTNKKRHINLGYLAMMLVLVAFLRIMLGIGLHFIIEISISISPAIT